VFDDAQVERAQLIRAAQQLGFTLAEIADLAAAYETGGLSRQKKIALLRAHLRGLDERAERLRSVRRYLTAKVRWLEGGEKGAPPVTPALLRAEPVSAGPPRRSRVSVR
jgi:DNA-binding transcriptional MerR regulator